MAFWHIEIDGKPLPQIAVEGTEHPVVALMRAFGTKSEYEPINAKRYIIRHPVNPDVEINAFLDNREVKQG